VYYRCHTKSEHMELPIVWISCLSHVFVWNQSYTVGCCSMCHLLLIFYYNHRGRLSVGLTHMFEQTVWLLLLYRMSWWSSTQTVDCQPLWPTLASLLVYHITGQSVSCWHVLIVSFLVIISKLYIITISWCSLLCCLHTLPLFLSTPPHAVESHRYRFLHGIKELPQHYLHICSAWENLYSENQSGLLWVLESRWFFFFIFSRPGKSLKTDMVLESP